MYYNAECDVLCSSQNHCEVTQETGCNWLSYVAHVEFETGDAGPPDASLDPGVVETGGSLEEMTKLSLVVHLVVMLVSTAARVLQHQ